MKIAKEKSVSFTGYRAQKIQRSSNDPNVMEKTKEELFKTIKALHDEGYTSFLSGMAEGFDLAAAQAVLQLRDECPDVELIAVIPFKGQDAQYSEEDKAKYKFIMENADAIVSTSEDYYKEAFFKRNDYLLDHCGMVVCYYDGQRGGTMYTYNRAKKRGLPILNIFDCINPDSPFAKVTHTND